MRIDNFTCLLFKSLPESGSECVLCSSHLPHSCFVYTLFDDYKYRFCGQPTMTTPVGGDIFSTNSKQILVTRDPVYNHPAVKDGHYIGREPHSYLPFAILVTIINPLLGPISIVFALMSKKSYKDGDLNYAVKWSNHAFMAGMITIVASCLIYIAIGFALGGPELRGGHSY